MSDKMPLQKRLIALAEEGDTAGLREALIREADPMDENCAKPLLPVSDPLAIGEEGLSAVAGARANGHAEVAGMIEAFIEARELSAHCQSGARVAKNIPSL